MNTDTTASIVPNRYVIRIKKGAQFTISAFTTLLKWHTKEFFRELSRWSNCCNSILTVFMYVSSRSGGALFVSECGQVLRISPRMVILGNMDEIGWHNSERRAYVSLFVYSKSK
jgi:hypothetical protein